MEYKTLNDADSIDGLFNKGTGTSIWYMKPGISRDFGMGYGWLAQHDMLPATPADLAETHTKLGSIEKTFKSTNDLEELFQKFQGEFWSPSGEARGLISSLGLRHTSMSVGDIIISDNEMFIVNNFGFKKINPDDNGTKYLEDE